MFRKISCFFIFVTALSISVWSQTATRGSDTILVIPFENKSKNRDFNWIGESFAESLPRLLGNRGLKLVSNQERRLAQRELGIPGDVIPSNASAVRIGQKLGASLIIKGDYNLPPATTDTAQLLVVNARIIKTRGGVVSEDFPDARKIGFTVSDAVGQLQKIQGQLAWEVLNRIDSSLYKLDKDQFPWSQNSLITEAQTDIPSRAFEAYIKGRLATDADRSVRENYFKNAMRLFAEARPGTIYAEAAMELAHLLLAQGKNDEALLVFQEVIGSFNRCKENFHQTPQYEQCRSDLYAEAVFYAASQFQKQNSYEKALAALRPLADDMKLAPVYNSLGSMAVEASRSEKKDEAKAAALLNEGIEYLKKAIEAAPDSIDAKFNYSVALFLLGEFGESARQLREVIAAHPKDGEAYFILAKALAGQNDATATAVDNEARRYLAERNRYAELEKNWSRSKKLQDIKLRIVEPQRRDFVSVVLSQKKTIAVQPVADEIGALLDRARTLYSQGNDDEALAVLRKILSREPMSAESHLLFGKIHLRRGDPDQAVNSLKTAIFWDNKLVDAYVALGRIYLEKGDCLQVKNYSASASEIAPENPEALAFKRQAERCSK